MKPLKDYALVGEVEVENKTASGLIISGGVETGSRPGVVLAVGPDTTHVKSGDKIALDWSKGLAVTVEGTKAVLVSEEHILGIF